MRQSATRAVRKTPNDGHRLSSAKMQARIEALRAELAAGREREVATTQVLQVINSSPGDLAPVFDAILEKAHSLSAVEYGALQLYDGERFRAVATRGYPERVADLLRQPYVLEPNNQLNLLLEGGRLIQIANVAQPHVGAANPRTEAAKAVGIRTILFLPLRRDKLLLGLISAGRTEERPFSDKEVALLENFAAQAVIAMENARLFGELRQRTDDLQESLEYQVATSDVLKVISRSTFDVQSVLDTLCETAARLCSGDNCLIATRDGDSYRATSTFGMRPEWDRRVRDVEFRPGRSTITGRTALERRVVHVPDITADPEYGLPGSATIGGIRTNLGVPLLRAGEPIGVIALARTRVEPFSERQVELVRTFADQAVIAIENARLISETREALEQQTATAEVLGVINSSPGDLAPVFDAMLEKAMHLCGAAFGTMSLAEANAARNVAARGVPPAFAEFRQRNPSPATPGSIAARWLGGEPVVHIVDVKDDDLYRTGDPHRRALVDLGGVRSYLCVGLHREGKAIGAIGVYRQEVRPFTEKQIALLQNFAAQAVIAMENARLITETREALEQQTATAEVLGVINSSPGNLAPVFDAMLERALRLCGAIFGNFMTYDGEFFHFVAARGHPEFDAWVRRLGPYRPNPGTTNARILQGETVVQITDLKNSEPYRQGDVGRRAQVDIGGFQTLLSVALRKDATLLGTLHLHRQDAQPFSEKQIALLENFAAQAVIAIENARLLGELRQRTEEVAELNRGLEARVAEQVDELGRVGRLKRFLAPQLAELIVSQGDENILESHRREIVVVFGDLRGYTAFTETAEPEEVLDFLREYHGALGPLVAQFEGTLDQFSGDGIMVFFNDPVPIPDAAERAVKMAVAMRDAAGTLVAQWRRRDRELGFGAGIAQGYATLGQIGFAERSGYTAIGTVCNLAARLCAEAKDGQILISGRVASADGGIRLIVQRMDPPLGVPGHGGIWVKR